MSKFNYSILVSLEHLLQYYIKHDFSLIEYYYPYYHITSINLGTIAMKIAI